MKKIQLLAIIILIPQLLFANAGTPLMWVPIFQLIWGNILIGIIEGVFIKLVYKAKLLRSILIMILANYVTWIAGYFLIDLYQNTFINTILDIKFVFEAWVASLIILYLITVFLEALFVYWIFKKNKTFKKSIIFSSIFNLVTYTGMILVYLQFSSYTFFTKTHIDQSLLDNRNEKIIIYFIDHKNKNLNTYDFISRKIIKIAEIAKNQSYPYLKLIPNKQDNHVQLFLSSGTINIQLVENKFCNIKDSIYYSDLSEFPYYKPKCDFRPINNRNWNAWTGDWAIEGLRIDFNETHKERFAYEVPWMMWDIRDVSVINDHELIVRIEGRIILMDINTKKIAFLFKANSYIVKRNE